MEFDNTNTLESNLKGICMILLLGANGYVGGEFSRQLTSQKIPFKAFRRHECELQSPADLAKYLDLHQVSTLINCIGYTGKPNVDACEADCADRDGGIRGGASC